MTVYLIQNPSQRAVKIGFTDTDPLERLRALQTGSVSELRLVASIPEAPMSVEKQLHAQFQHLRVRTGGEWFIDEPSIRLAFVDHEAALHRLHLEERIRQVISDLTDVLRRDTSIRELEAVLKTASSELDPRDCGGGGVRPELRENNDPFVEFWHQFESRFVWDLVPFPFMHDLYVAWLRSTSPSRMPVGATAFANSLAPLIESSERWGGGRRHKARTGDKLSRPLAEEIGLIGELGRFGLGQALADLRRWRDEVPGAENLRTAVNFSVSQLREPDIVDVVTEALALAQIEPSALKIEVTESTLMENLDLTFDILTDLRDQGIQISIDDFGTGYSSLSYLQRLPITTLKIDRSFISGLNAPADNHSQMIVESILALAQSMNLDVIAEGVETHGQLAILRKLGVPRAQGFLWSGALPADEIESWLRNPQRAL